MRKPSKFTCDGCYNDYVAVRRNAIAFVFLKDDRCNHIVVKCDLCGRRETIFLRADLLCETVEGGSLHVRTAPEANDHLRARAERVWGPLEAAAEGEAEGNVSTLAPPVTEHDLTPRLAAEVERFGRALASMPDDLLWDGFESDHDRPYPDRWIE